MAVRTDIISSYRSPRRVMRRMLDRGASEGQALALNFAACLIIFVAQWPRLSREAFVDPSIALEARLGGALMGIMIIGPLLLYTLAALSHLVAKLLKGQGDWLGARIATFWAFLAVAPFWLLHGLTTGFLGASLQADLVGALLLIALSVIWICGMIEAEQGPTPSAAL